MSPADRVHLAAVDDEGPDTRTWDEFWAEVQRKEAAERGEEATTVIRGVRVPIPHDLPLKFTQSLEAMQDADDEDLGTLHALLTDLFGESVLDQWVANGMTGPELQTVLTWGIAHGQGRPLTFAEAYEARRTQGKSLAPNRSTRRASASSGGRSKRTSAASTATKRKK